MSRTSALPCSRADGTGYVRHGEDDVSADGFVGVVEADVVDGSFWVVTRECGPDLSWHQAGVLAPVGRPVVVGREGDLLLGVAAADDGISRTALTVTATDDGWRIARSNRNGAVLHPWGLAPYVAPARTLLDWPLVAVHVAGTDDSSQHWVLLHSRTPPEPGGTAEEPARVATRHSEAPKPLTPAEVEAVWTVFVDVLAWPPRRPALPLQLKQAARRLRISESGVQLRLEGAMRKALSLGLPRPVRLTEPDYVHVLVGAGYLPPPVLEPVRTLRRA